jgi:uncharacterized membrane protein YphA (DoxX/SURF4 family)
VGKGLERLLPAAVVVVTVYDLALLLLRVVTGFIVWQHGAQKLFGILGGAQADPFTLAWIAGAAEFLGGIALAAGFLARPVALILAVALYLTQLLDIVPGLAPQGRRRRGTRTMLPVRTRR